MINEPYMANLEKFDGKLWGPTGSNSKEYIQFKRVGIILLKKKKMLKIQAKMFSTLNEPTFFFFFFLQWRLMVY